MIYRQFLKRKKDNVKTPPSTMLNGKLKKIQKIKSKFHRALHPVSIYATTITWVLLAPPLCNQLPPPTATLSEAPATSDAGSPSSSYHCSQIPPPLLLTSITTAGSPYLCYLSSWSLFIYYFGRLKNHQHQS